MADTFTTNYAWTKPQVNADTGIWGGLLNTDLDAIDGTVFTISGVANAALPKAGGQITGNITYGTASGLSPLHIAGTANASLTVQATNAPANFGAWQLYVSSSGANATLAFRQVSDNGLTVEKTALTLNGDGSASFGGALAVTGAITLSGGGALTSFNGRTTAAAVLTTADVNTALGLTVGSAAGFSTGTSGGTVPLLNGNNTWSGTNGFGTLTATTPAAGDSSTNAATTAFVNARGLQSSGQQTLSASTTLARSHAGANLLLNTSGVTITFSSLACTYALSNTSTGDITLVFPTSSDFRTTLHAGEQIIMAGDGSGNWRLLAASNLYNAKDLGIPVNTQSANYTVQASDLGGCIYFTTSATLTIPAGLAIGSGFSVAADASVTVTFSYGGTLRSIPANGTGTHTLAGPGDAFCHQKKTTEIWVRGDIT